jgi:CzcA family heavy metal efflux pump
MIRWIVATSLRFRLIVVALGVGLIYFGVQRVKDIPIDVFPEFAPPRIEVQTLCLGLAPAEVEEQVTVPIENAMNGVPGVEILRSSSVPQLSSVTAILRHGADELAARQLVRERVAIATQGMPTWAAPPVMMPPVSTTSRVMKIGVTAKNKSMMDLSMIAYWKIRSRLLAVPGVANVAIWGEQLKMLQVQVDPERLADLNLTLDGVMEKTSDALEVGLLRYSGGAHIGTGGFIDTPEKRLPVHHILTSTTPEALAQVPVAKRGGKQLVLGDVAQLVWGPQGMVGDAVINDGAGLMLIVEKYPWGNTLEVTRAVEAALDGLKQGLPDVEIDTKIFRPAEYISASIDNLSRALILGCILVVAVVFAFLYELRTALICIVAMPLSLLAAVLVLHWTGSTLNTMVLAGFVIALGVVVDDAILDVENIMRRLRERRAAGDTKPTAQIILDASVEVRHPIFYATLIVVLAVVPVFFMQALSGAFFKPLILAYVMAIMASLIVAVTVTPVLCLFLLRKSSLTGRESPLSVWLGRGYTRLLGPATRKPMAAYITVAVITLAGAITWPMLGYSLLPPFKERDFLIHWIADPSTSHPEMLRITKLVSRELRSIPGVRNFGAHIGQAFLADEIVGVANGENWISIDPKVDYDETVAAIKEVVDGYPGLYRGVETYLDERISEVLTGESEPIVVRIFGSDLNVLRVQAELVRQAMTTIKGINDVKKDINVDVPHIQVTERPDAALHYGLKPGDVRRASAVLMAGEEVGDIFSGGRTYDVQVWTTPDWRHSFTSVEQMLLDTPTGQRVRLKDVADVRITPTPNVIKREDESRRIDIQAGVEGRDLAAVAQDVQRVLETIKFPLGYHAIMQGAYVELQSAQSNLQFFAIIALIGIYLLLQLSFRSWRLAALSFLTLPSALVGGVLAAFAGGGIITLGSLVGFLSVLGIAARNGIMMISHFQHLELYENQPFGLDLVLRGARERLRPILMTTGATAFAILPLAIYGNQPGQEIEFPMAVVILGGLVTSTLLNLFILPALYLRFGAGTLPLDEAPATPAVTGGLRGAA